VFRQTGKVAQKVAHGKVNRSQPHFRKEKTKTLLGWLRPADADFSRSVFFTKRYRAKLSFVAGPKS
jgi:hypothetical protein